MATIFNSFASNNLSFTNIKVSETDVGTVLPFTATPPQPNGIATATGASINWSGLRGAGVYYANSTETLNFSYTVTATDGSSLIDSMSQLYTADTILGNGVSLKAVEKAYDSSGILLGSDSFTLGATNASSVQFAVAQTSITVQVSLTLSISAAGSNMSELLLSTIRNNFGTVATSATASIGDIVFNDMAGTGLESGFDAGPGVAGVTVELLNGTGTAVMGITTTDANGRYNFTGLSAGVYEMAFFAPTGYGFSPQGVGSNAGINSSANQLTGITAPITVTAGQAIHTVEAGLIPGGSAGGASGSIGNTVWFDSNGNGLLDIGETGVAGVTVDLLSGSGAFIAATTTDASGSYQFANLAAGTYEVKVLAPAGDGFTTENVATTGTGVNSAVDSTGLTAVITLTAGQIDTAVNAGLTQPASLVSTVWLDTNKDGLLNNGEAGLGGVTVELLNAAGTAILATTTTNAAGTYAFTGIGAGVYEVAFIAPTGDTFTTQGVGSNPALNSSANIGTGITAQITLTGGQNDTTVNAGLQIKPASLGSTVFLDANRDGLLDNGETGVAGVTVELLNAAGTSILATTTTDSNGTYAFTGLTPGAYEVEFLTPAGDILTTAGVGTNPAINSSANATTGITAAVTLTAGQANTSVNAGLQIAPASLGSTVFLDANRDGLLDNGETGVAGVTVELLNAAGTSILATTTTNSSGAYAFTNLNPGAYEVAFLAPTGDILTTQNVGTNPAVNSSANATTGITAPVTLTAGQTNPNVNAGLQIAPASLGSTVFLDTNHNGLLDNGEGGVAGVTVELLNAAGTAILATTTTNSNGTYAFTGLNAGTYEVEFLAPTGDTFTTANVGTNPAINSSANQTTGITAPITLTAGQTNNNIEAGLVPVPVTTASIGNTVWLDTNHDGLDNNGEAGVAGVTVELLNAAGTAILAITTTDASGAYQFANLAAGTYEVQVLAPAGDGFTTANAATTGTVKNSAVNGSGLTSAITLATGQINNNVNAGLTPPPATLGSFVFLDANRDGVFDNGETGVAGVTVRLLNAAGTAILATTTTSSSGQYQFANLNAGAYEVAFIAPTGDIFTTAGAAGVFNNSSANATTGITAPVTLTAGQTNNTVNAGLQLAPASLGSTVFLDANRDGLLDNGETGVAGVTVELLNAAGTAILAITTTNAGGSYAFTNLNPGSYEIAFIAPTGDIFTAKGIGTNPAINSSAFAATGITAPITLTAGQNNPTVNAGLQLAPASLGSTVFLDANRDGLLDNGETGVAGVTVELLNAAGTAILAITTTNAGGSYAFTNLNPGSYEVAFIAPTGDIFTAKGIGTNPAINSSAFAATGITAPITLTAGQNNPTVNAGLQLAPASLGSTVFFDANRDGLLDNGETGVAGVTVELLNAAGTAILAITTTNASGSYAFTNLNPGAYEVKVLAPTGDIFTAQGVGTNPAINSSVNAATGVTAPVTLTAGQTNLNVNAGLKTPPASIGNIVWLDTNKDGLLNNGEAGVAGVTVELLNAAGTSILATTTTNSTGAYNFTNLNAGVYEVKFLAPTGDIFTTQGIGSNGAVNSSANATTGVTAPITLTAGQTNNNVEAGLRTTSSISVLKQPSSVVVNQCGQETYTFSVTNTGTTALNNVHITDNIGTVAKPNYVTPRLVTTGTNGVLGAGQTWVYTETVSQINCATGGSGDGGSHSDDGHSDGGHSDGGHSDGSHSDDGHSDGSRSDGSRSDGSRSDGSRSDGSRSDGSRSDGSRSDGSRSDGSRSDGSRSDGSRSDGSRSDGSRSDGSRSDGSHSDGSHSDGSHSDDGNHSNACNPADNSKQGDGSSHSDGSHSDGSHSDGSHSDGSHSDGSHSDGSHSDGSHSDGSHSDGSHSDGSHSDDSHSDGSHSDGSHSDGSHGDDGNHGNACNPVHDCKQGDGSSHSDGSRSDGSRSDGSHSDGSRSDGSHSDGSRSDGSHSDGSHSDGSRSDGSHSDGSHSDGSHGDDGSKKQQPDGCCCDSGSKGGTNVTGVADTVTVTASNGATVTATDTKEIQVLGHNSNISVNGTATTASLSATYGAAQTLEFTYNPGNIVSLKQVQTGLGIVIGTNSNTMAFMKISNNANFAQSGASIYFQGAVTSGEKIFADAATNVLTNTPIAGGHFSTTAGSDIFAFVFASQQAFLAGAAPIQTMDYNTSGNQAMHIGDTIGSLSVIGYVGATGGHLAT